MKTKKLNKILSVAFVFSALFFALTFFVSNAGAAKQKSSESALLNPKYKEQISSFLIKKNGEEISIEKQGSFYLVKKDKTIGFADSKTAGTLIENFCKIRRIYRISFNNSKDVEKNRQMQIDKTSVLCDDVQKSVQLNGKLNADSAENQTDLENIEDDAARIVFFDLNGNSISDVEFYSQNCLLGRIEFLSAEKRYETEDDFSQFLTTDFNYWADGNLFPEVKNPVKITYSVLEEEKEPKALGKTGRNYFLATDSDGSFPGISSAVLSLRHGNLSYKDFYEYPAALYSSLEVEDGGGRVSTVFFKKVENPEHFICLKTVAPSPLDSAEDKNTLSSQNAVFELSKWTVDGIEKLF